VFAREASHITIKATRVATMARTNIVTADDLLRLYPGAQVLDSLIEVSNDRSALFPHGGQQVPNG
jgi:hypothetical protein